MTAIKIVVEMYEIVLLNAFVGFSLFFFLFGNYSGEVVSSTYLNIIYAALSKSIYISL